MNAASTLWWKDEALTSEHFKALAEAGLSAVEISDYHPNFNYLRASWLTETGQVCRDAGLVVATVHTHLAWHDPRLRLMNLEPRWYTRTVENYFRIVDALELLGAKILLTHDLDLNDEDGQENPQKRHQVIGGVRKIADYAQQAGLKLALENLPGRWSGKVAKLQDLIGEIEHPAVGMCLDVAHAFRGDDPVQAARDARQQLLTLHINDSTGEHDHSLPGTANIDWVALMATLRDINYQGFFIYELKDELDLVKLKDNLNWLHGLNGE